MDPAKLKVVELREELQARGLNTKGVKAELVQRLKEALEKETQTTIPDTSILETSTEEMDTSQTEEETPIKKEQETPKKEKKPSSTAKSSPVKGTPQKTVVKAEVKKEEQENGDESEQGDDAESDENQEKAEAEGEETKTEGEKTEDEKAGKLGEKRKRDRDDNEPANKKERQEKQPIVEDEPEYDAEKTLLSWFDSDLLLQINKENFLSAKPVNEGAMGYIWSGVRATQGISSGKICYEVKLKEAMKWSDLTERYTLPERKRYDRRERDDKRKKDSKKEKDEEKKDDKDEEKKDGEAEKMETDEAKTEPKEENGDAKEEETKEEAKKSDKTKEEEEKKDAKDDKKEGDDEKKEGEESKDKEEEPKKEPKEPIPTHFARVGFSVGGTNLQLGENQFSYGYQNTGKFVNNKTVVDYGITFGEGDVIGAFLSIDKKELSISYTVNGAVQPVAITVPCSELPENYVLYPHVSVRNFEIELNFGDQEEPWFPIPEELSSYQFLSKFENKIAGPKSPATRKECEVYLMIGLPASGKTHWVCEHIKNNADKQYTIIGNHSLQEKMTVDGESIRQRFGGSWKLLNDKLQKTLNRLTDIATARRRHFIIDQTNLFQAAQRRKMRAFEGYQRRAVVVIPEAEEQERRLKQQVERDGKSIPEQTIWELKAGMEVPDKADWLEETIWPELDEEKAKEVVKKYNEDAKAKGYSKRFPRRQHQGRHDRYDRRDNRGWGRDQRSGGGYGSWGRQGGGWDRRDRGPPRQGGWGDYGSRNGRQSGGYGGGNRRDGGGSGGWGQQDWGSGRQGGGGGWNAQMYAGYKNWNQGSWAGGHGGQGSWGGQGGWGNQRSGGGQGQAANAQAWNQYYAQYGQGGGWQQQAGAQQQAGYDYSADV